MPIQSKPAACSGCALHGDGLGFVPPSGHGTSGLLIVGEAAGKAERAEGRPFIEYAQSGSLLEKALRLWGSSRGQHRIANIVSCQPPRDWLDGAPYEFDAIQHCRPYLDHEIETMKPKCILAVGGIALRELTGMEGKYRGVSYLRGYAIPLAKQTNIPVVSTFHPSFLRQGNPHLFGVLLHDLKRAMEIARVGIATAPLTRYQPHPSLDDIVSFEQRVRDNPAQLLTYDIETPMSADLDEDERDEDTSAVITQIQFSLAPNEGIVLKPEHMDIARRIIALPNPKAGHNSWLFDDIKMRANGFEFGGPLPHDTMVMFHHMQPDLPANLQFVASFYGMDRPWKHLFQYDMGEYGAADVDAPQRIMALLPDQLRKRGLWDGYYRRTYQVRPILQSMEELGVPINDQKRVEFGSELDAAKKVEWEKMQELVPEECRNVHPKQGYKKVPKDLTGLVERSFFVESTTNDEGVPNFDAHWTKRYCRIEPFTPSPKQLLRYMRFKNHPVPRNFKTDKDTTDAKSLERLEKSTGDFLYRYVRTYREIQTMKGTFVDGWKPASDGRVHTTFTFKPATAQLSSRDPNVQNSPQHTGLAEKFQAVIEAPEGYKLVDFDHKSFHALTLGFLAEDEDYIRVSRIDIHSFVTSEFLRMKPAATMLAMKDDELADYLATIKKAHKHTRDYKIKRVLLGWQYGRGYKAIYQAYREDFTGETEAKRMVETLESCFPKAVRYRAVTQHEADKPPNYLTTPFGFIRWFWDVFDYRPPREGTRSVRRCAICGLHHSNGEQAEQAIAYRPANCAFGMMREEALDMRERELDSRYGLINNIHDCWKFCCLDSLVDECIPTIGELMERPSPYLKHPKLAPDGLWCAVEAKVGQNASKMEVVKHARTEASLPILNAQ
jgi:uracil-DNA glycosylase family 4